ncbi:MAG: hypothetical protein MZV65_36205 [Chromatiales bacterium]|nr:hypothetical protein [Chromatiales bacterium]
MLLLLAVRKQELTAARWAEFDLDRAAWAIRPASGPRPGRTWIFPCPPSP